MSTFDIVKKNFRTTALTIEQCEKLPTKRLLAYYKKYRSKRWYGICGCCGTIAYDQETKQPIQDAFNEYFDQIKSVLDARSHVQ